jgi:hypothetical protein
MSRVEALLMSTAGIKVIVATAGNPARGGLKLKYGFLIKKPDPGDVAKGVEDTDTIAEDMATVRLELLACIPGCKTFRGGWTIESKVFSGIFFITENISTELFEKLTWLE